LAAMSQENVETLRSAVASGPAGLLEILDEQVEWDYVGAFPEAVTYHGPEQVGQFLSAWARGFDDFGFEADEIVDAGDSVMVYLHQWGRGRGSGVEVDSRTWQVFTFRDGKVVHCRGYETKAEALEAAGLSE
jgi:ketosteroid isomerase-like protein